MDMNNSLAKHYLENAIANFRQLKSLGEKALAQLEDKDLFLTIDEESNSIAIIIKHLSGNMLSRWTDFLSTDGEKASRDRDSEFIMDTKITRADLMALWEKGWDCVFKAIEVLGPLDLDRSIFIREERHMVIEAINRQLTHYAYHVGQIVFLAKHIRSKEWNSLSIPKGKSEEFNRQKMKNN
jgi:hypothetical protein